MNSDSAYTLSSLLFSALLFAKLSSHVRTTSSVLISYYVAVQSSYSISATTGAGGAAWTDLKIGREIDDPMDPMDWTHEVYVLGCFSFRSA